MYTTKSCRECHTELRGVTYLQLAIGLRGQQSLCLTCIDKMMIKYHTTDIRTMVRKYVDDNKTDSVAQLRNRVAELERLLDGITKPTGQQTDHA